MIFTYTATNNGLDNVGVLTGSVEYFAGGFSADFDGDGDVDGNDLTDWKASFGVNNGADADQDGDSDGADVLAWQRQLGSGLATATTSAVPEPATVFLALGWAAIVGLRRAAPRTVCFVATGACCLASLNASPATAAVFNDRHYSLGDLSNIGFDTQGVNLTAFPADRHRGLSGSP